MWYGHSAMGIISTSITNLTAEVMCKVSSHLRTIQNDGLNLAGEAP